MEHSSPPCAEGSSTKSGASGTRLLLLGGVILLLNHCFNLFMEESGLYVSMVTATLPPHANSPDGIAAFEHDSGTLADASTGQDRGLVRSELLRHRDGEHTYAFVTVHQYEPSESEMTAAARAAGAEVTSAPQMYRTVFPERARWRQLRPAPEERMRSQVGHCTYVESASNHHPSSLLQLSLPWRAPPQGACLTSMALGQVGYLELLAQNIRISVNAEHVDSLKQSWIDLGYNSLGETGVVRCDLLQVLGLSSFISAEYAADLNPPSFLSSGFKQAY